MSGSDRAIGILIWREWIQRRCLNEMMRGAGLACYSTTLSLEEKAFTYF